MSTMTRSPLRYPGGKTRAVRYLYRFIPPYREFREPFFGGGSVSFYCLQQQPDAAYYASDLNYELYCFWHTLSTNPEPLVAEVARIKESYTDGRALFAEILERRDDDLSELQRAVDFFVLNRITFSGVVDAGGYSEQSFHKRFTRSSITRLRKAHEVVKHITFAPEHYRTLLDAPGEDVLIFLDPPYYSATSSRLYGKDGELHTGFDHEQFAGDLRVCKHHWLITYDNSEFVQELFDGFSMVEWELQYGMNNYKKNSAAKGAELLIANYDLEALAAVDSTGSTDTADETDSRGSAQLKFNFAP